jgi:hypothetical protein
VVADAGASFDVSSGGIVDFGGPDLVPPGEEAAFDLRFGNDRPEAVEAVAAVSVYDERGEPVDHLPPQLLTVASGGEASATFTATTEFTGGTYWAEAIAVIGGTTYGPMMHAFSVERWVYLPVVLKNR